MTTLRARVWKKPCAICGHGKSLHRAGYCGYQRRTMGQTWLGRQLVTKYCTCSGYQPKEDMES